MSKCDVCINKKYCVNHLDARTMCPQMDYVLFTPSYKINYDRLISKTPEELAEIMASDCPPNYPHINCREYEKYDGNLDCCKCWLDWLTSPADKEGEG